MSRHMLYVDESEEEEDYIEVGNDEENPQEGEEEEVQPVEVDLNDEIEEEKEDDLAEEDDEDLQEEEEEEKEDELEEEDDEDLQEEQEDKDLLEEEEEDKDLQEEEKEDLEEEEEEGGSSNPYYFGKKYSPTLSDYDERKNHDCYPSYCNPNENQCFPPTVDNHTNITKPKMPTAKPTIPSKRAARNRKHVDVTRSKIRKVFDGDKKENRFSKKESGKKFSGTCRLWSEDDEITILKGMIDYHSEKEIDPYADMGEFHKFIIKLLHIDVTRDQLIRKIRRMKKKYQDNMEKVENGKDIVFPRPHEQKSLKLSKKIWGAEDDNDDDDDDVNDHESKAIDKAGQEKFWSLYPCLNESLHLEQFSNSLLDSGMSFVKERLSSIGSTKANEFEDKWRQLHVAETEVKLKRAQLILEQTKLILNAIK